MGDTGNALLAAIAIAAALYHRDKTGVGQEVSTSIVNAGLLHTSYAWIRADGSPGDWEHVDGQQYGLSPFYRLYECADGRWLFLAAVSDQEHDRLVAVMGEAVPGLQDGQADDITWSKALSTRFLEQPAEQWFAELDKEASRSRSWTRPFAAPCSTTPMLRPHSWSARRGQAMSGALRTRACLST